VLEQLKFSAAGSRHPNTGGGSGGGDGGNEGGGGEGGGGGCGGEGGAEGGGEGGGGGGGLGGGGLGGGGATPHVTLTPCPSGSAPFSLQGPATPPTHASDPQTLRLSPTW